jgi:xanthine dehydrogenase accessory factor
MHEIDKTLAAIRAILAAERSGILVTILATRGSTYRRAGARAVIREDGESFGTISGGCLERDLAARARTWLANFAPRRITYDSTRADDLVFGTGLGCRGEVDLLLEPFDAARPPRLLREFRWNGREAVTWTTTLDGRELLVEQIRPPRALVVFGGGADVAPVAVIAESVGWDVAVIAPRDIHPNEVAETLDLSLYDAAVVMTHNYLHDLALLEALAASPVPYVGLLGPKARGEELLAAMTSLPADFRDRLHNPIGLDLGGETPEEIALAIVAELQRVAYGRSAQPLRTMDEPIHTCR